MTAEATARFNVTSSGGNKIQELSTMMTGLNQSIELIAKGFQIAKDAGEKLVDVVEGIVGVSRKFSTFEAQLTHATGSVGAANAMMDSLIDNMGKAFEVDKIMEGAVALERLGMDAEKILPAIGRLAGTTRVDFTTMVEAIQSAAVGRAMGLERLGISAEKLAAVMGSDDPESIFKSAGRAEEALVRLSNLPEFSHGIEKAASSFGGQLTQFKNMWELFVLDVGKAGVFDTVKNVIGGILDYVRQLYETGEGQRLGKVVGHTLSEFLWDVAESLAIIADALIGLARKLGVESPATAKSRLETERAQLDALRSERMAPAREPSWVERNFPHLRFLASREEAMDAQIARLEEGLAGGEDNTIYGALRARRMAQELKGQEPEPESTERTRPPGGETFEGRKEYVLEFPATGEQGFYSQGLEGSQQLKWERLFGYSEEENESMKEAWLESYSTFMDRKAEIDEKHKTMESETMGWMVRGWDATYQRITALAQTWQRMDDIRLKDMVQAGKSAMTDTLADFINMKTRAAAVEELYEAAAAIRDAAGQNWWGAARHLAAAAAFAVVGGVASGIVRGLGDSDKERESSSNPNIGGELSGGTGIEQSTGITTQYFSFTVINVHNGTAVYGDERAFYNEKIRPLIQEDLNFGAIGVPA